MAGGSPTDGFTPEALASLRSVFFQECEENLAELETGLMRLQAGETDWELVNTVFRAAHSIKGGAAVFALDRLVSFAHDFESALSEVRDGRMIADDTALRLLLRAGDALADLVRAARDGVEPPEDRVTPVAAELAALVLKAGGGGSEGDAFADLDFTPQPVAFDLFELPPGAATRWSIRFQPHADLYAKANEPLILLRELRALGQADIVLDDSKIPLLQDLEPEDAYLSWTITLTTTHPETTVREIFEFVDGDCVLEIEQLADELDPPVVSVSQKVGPPAATAAAIPAPAAAAAVAASPQTIRVDLERVDRLIDLVSELVINQAMLAQRVADHGLAPTSTVGLALEELDHITRDIQDNVMSIRAQPVKGVFQRMSRLVREVEAMTGKQVRLVTEGEGTEVDRTVIERLTDPLTHMVRNSIDHGIESVEGRRAAGKPEQGQIRISAAHRAGRIVIDVQDDGGGINRPRVRDIAIKRGVIEPDAVLTDEEIDNLIFAPGFSTAEVVSDLSGRGVGMDVVRRSVESMGGRLSVSSAPGEGTLFSLSLPLTLAVLDGMVVTVGAQSLVAPLTTLLESVKPTPDAVRKLGPNVELLAVRGALLPLIDLGDSLGYGASPKPATERIALIVEDDRGERAALLVDDILGQRQVVIKSLEANYHRVPGVAAATILGDGRVALILDVNSIVARHGAMRSEAA